MNRNKQNKNLNKHKNTHNKPAKDEYTHTHTHTHTDSLSLSRPLSLSLSYLTEWYVGSCRQRDRVFAGFMLHEIGTSALVDVYLCVPTGKKTKNCDHKAGKFSVLGGKTEMPFQFDRLFRYKYFTPLIKDIPKTCLQKL